MSNLEEEKRIKFPAQHYVGYRQDRDVLTGFMTPEGTDSAAKKRKESVDKWVEAGSWAYVAKTDGPGYDRVKKDGKPSEVFDNKPMPGFGIEQRLNRGGSWYGNQDKWKIDDPRGFQLEISGNNLQKIIEYTTIVNGVIQGECIWARLGSDNILVPVNTEIYQNTMVNTERYAKNVSLKDVKIGDWVVQQNGEEGQYVGLYYIVGLEYGERKLRMFKVSPKKRYVFRNGDSWSHVASPKIAEVRPCDVPAPTEQEINELQYAAKEDFRRGISGQGITGLGVTSVANPTHTIKLVEGVDDPAGYGYVFNPHEGLLAAAYVSSLNRSWESAYDRQRTLYDRELNLQIREVRKSYYGDGKEYYYGKTVEKHIVAPYITAEYEFDTSYGVASIKV